MCSKYTLDFASVNRRDNWLHHPVYGDPSWDAFERDLNNPVHRGVAGLEWPVNGFFFRDPVTSHWYVYIGNYPAGYATEPGKASVCTVSRSCELGKAWEHLGPVFSETPFYFEGDSSPVQYAPDVSVVYADGRYHMAYDWATSDTTWKNIRSNKSGIGYAWSEKPEGPFHRHKKPIIRNGQLPKNGIFKKYNRVYASSLIRREHDWLILTIIDSGPYYAWGLAGMTSDNPEGPYGHLQPLFHVEGNNYQPPLMEYFPVFIHDGWVYAPSTSVALNRNFQMIQKAPVEEAMRSEAWELCQHGSIWHAVNEEHEAEGIWGQTFSGFIDEQKRFHVMFPSKDADDKGTINLASRLWKKPYLTQGFRISGHKGSSLAQLMFFYDEFCLDCKFTLHGMALFFWGNTAPLGPNAPTSNSTLHDFSWPRGYALHLERNKWQFLKGTGERTPLVLGSGTCSEKTERTLTIYHSKDGDVQINMEGQMLWAGHLEVQKGSVGALVKKDSFLFVERFLVKGCACPAEITLLHTEALLGAGQGFVGWQEIRSPLFRHGVGAVHRTNSGRAKWNFFGTGFRLWLPKGPEYGTVKVLVDGHKMGEIHLYEKSSVPSQPVLSVGDLRSGFHAVVLKGASCLVIDSLDVLCPLLDQPKDAEPSAAQDGESAGATSPPVS